MSNSVSTTMDVCDALQIDVVTDALGRRIAVPESEADGVRLVRALGDPERGVHMKLAPIGTGSSFAWCRPDHDEDTLCMSTCGMIPEGASGIVEYVPGDGVVTALGGTSLAELKDAVRIGGHRLTPEIAGPATLGGVLAAGRSGIDRCSFGPARLHVLGMRVLDGSGRVARTGGRLVKNVTGFDLHRLHVGARGSLGIILEASMRLMPIPEAEVVVRSTAFASAADAVEVALEIRADQAVAPNKLCVLGTQVVVGLSGRERQVAAAQRALKVHVPVSFEDSGERGTEELTIEADLGPSVQISTRPSRCRGIVHALESVGIEPGTFAVHPDAALIDIRVDVIRTHESSFMAEIARAMEEAEAELLVRGTVPRKVAELARSMSRIPTPQRTWTNRLYTSFDPHGLLRIPGQHHFSA